MAGKKVKNWGDNAKTSALHLSTKELGTYLIMQKVKIAFTQKLQLKKILVLGLFWFLANVKTLCYSHTAWKENDLNDG